MEENITSKKSIVLAVLFAGLIIGFSVIKSIYNSETFIVFCDVGQGDGAYIRIHNKIDVLVDAGPDRKILQCIGKYMPFFDKNIELAFISHPQKDHFGGYEYILDRYSISLLILNPLNNKTTSYQNLLKKLDQKNIKLKSLYTHDIIDLNEAKINVLWPTKSYLEKNTYKTTRLNNGFEIKDVFVNLNKFSYVLNFKINNKSVLFTSDIGKEISNKISSAIDKVYILKVPHHGSKNGATKKFIEKLSPYVSIISVGKNNSYGHPNKEILDYLNSINSITKRTDLNGDIIIKL
ncbi:MAG: hypothetical protein ABH812_01460 [bacterium]